MYLKKFFSLYYLNVILVRLVVLLSLFFGKIVTKIFFL